jgi:hypothetical protein
MEHAFFCLIFLNDVLHRSTKSANKLSILNKNDDYPPNFATKFASLQWFLIRFTSLRFKKRQSSEQEPLSKKFKKYHINLKNI